MLLCFYLINGQSDMWQPQQFAPIEDDLVLLKEWQAKSHG